MPPAASAPARPDTSAESLRRRADFDALARRGRARRHRLFTVRVRRNGLGRVRYGFAVSRRVGGAVVRNRVRRRLRALVRELPPHAGFDVLVAAHPAITDASFDDVQQALSSTVAGALERLDGQA
ncbi:MAG: ribonuclease P protein component [Chloroflexi bacterium]|nr:ribonuclease P protein component [Chloroflexota bacterium]